MSFIWEEGKRPRIKGQTWGSLGDVSTPGVIYGLQYTTFPSQIYAIDNISSPRVIYRLYTLFSAGNQKPQYPLANCRVVTTQKGWEVKQEGGKLVVEPQVIYIPSCWGDLGDLEEIYVPSHSTPTPR